MKLTESDRARFLKFLAPGENGCIVWTGTRIKDGYGHFGLNGKNVLATHVAWHLAGNERPPGKIIMHSCDNPPCCNPEHLSCGTQEDNMRDRARKWRGARGAMPFGVRLQQGRYIGQYRPKGLGRQAYIGSFDTWQEASALAIYHKNLDLYPDIGVN